MVAQEKKLLEKYGLQVEWQTYGSGGATREALVANQVDVAFMAPPPFLIGWDKGVPAKIALGFNTVPCALVTNDPNIKTLKDFAKASKIAIPSPGSVQDIMIAMAAKKELGNAQAMQEKLVTMPHPDAMAALLAKKDLAGHYATPPYIFEELAQPGYHEVVSDQTAFGSEYSFNVGVVTDKFVKESPLAYAGFIQAINDAMVWINENKTEAAKLLATQFKLTPEKTLEYLNWQGMNFTSAPYGLMGFAEFMKDAGFISKVPKKLSEIATENVLAIVGSRSGGSSVYEQLQSRK
jgi:NitT/TauT family transport system substrate-binding protein